MLLNEFQYMTLQTCMRQSGCPLCRAIWRMDAARFAWYVNEGVLDEETQGQVVRALGFCAPHALSVSLLEGDDTLWSHLGSCMVYIHVIQYALLPQLQRFLISSGHWFLSPLMSKVFSRLRHLFHPDLCPLCFDHRQHEKIYAQRFVEAFCSNAGFREMYLQAGSLCVPHFQQIRGLLPQEPLVQLLQAAEIHALEHWKQATTALNCEQLRQWLCLLSGADTILWSDFTSRVVVDTSVVQPPPCLACQQREETQLASAFLGHLSSELEGSSDYAGLSLCPWHAWWVLNQSTLHPELISQVEPVLRRTSSLLLHSIKDASQKGHVCHLCEWSAEQEAAYMEGLQRQVHDSAQQIPLCLFHARGLLQRFTDEETTRDVAFALLCTLAPLGKRLEAYIYKCTERYQDQMQPEERIAWFDAIRWFGGSQAAQFLLPACRFQ